MSTDRHSKLITGPFTFRKLNLFCRVATLGSVTKAAKDLNMVQPAVTAQLRAIESQLGVKLVYRDGRNLALTEAGHSFHRWCEGMLGRCDELSRTLSGVTDGTAGYAVIAASMTAGTYRLSELLIRYRQLNPHTTVTTHIGNTQTATEAVRAGACDFAVLLLDPQQDLKGLDLEYLWDDPLWLVSSPDRAEQAAAGLDNIATLPFITSPRHMLRRTLEDEQLYSMGILSREVVIELGHPEAIKQAVKQGLGFAFIEASAITEEIARGELVVTHIPSIDLHLPLYLARRKDKILAATHRRLMNFILEETRKLNAR
jgi:DNA-binding transcriptional LysR family regulator